VEESACVNEWIAVGEKRGEARGVQEAILKPGGTRLGPAPERTEGILMAVRALAHLDQILDCVFAASSRSDLLATA
jgi:hypothetical protein